ncbi:MAG TPA: hypothetical protein VEA44_16120 [Caulobacter sp.]|nr:hypothetical protein [Caulobacter sp.]
MSGASHLKPPSLREEVTWLAAAAVAGRAFGVRPAEIINCQGRRTRAVGRLLEARRAAVYLAAVGGDLGSRALMRATGLDQNTVRPIKRAIEDSRELKAELDALLDDMTAQMQMALRSAGAVAA